ncbi:MAG: DUF3108 domain-containing protein [Mucinivorans sp.]
MRRLFTYILIAYCIPTIAQDDCGRTIAKADLAFAAGESLTYSVTYSAAIFKTDVADITFTTTAETKDGLPVFHINAVGQTRPFYNMFFEMEDIYDTWLDQSTLRPIKAVSRLKEGGYLYNTSFDYMWDNMQVHTLGHNIKRAATYTKTMKLGECSFDALALFFNMRCRDFNLGQKNDHLVQLVLEDTIRTISYRLVGKEKRKLLNMGQVNTLKFICQFATSNDDTFKNGAEFYLWVSDDKNHIPIYVEAPIRVGRITASIASWSGLEHPFSSIIIAQ